jgi:hypothetical protein
MNQKNWSKAEPRRMRKTSLGSRLAAWTVASVCLFGAADAGTLNIPFTVNVQFSPAMNNSAYCKQSGLPGAFGADVTVVCRTGNPVDLAGVSRSPVHGGAYRYLMHIARGGSVLGTVDADFGVGTLSYWRVVDQNDRSYVEMGVAW